MKGKANDICPKCKHCEGLGRLTKMYSCKHYNNYPDSAIGMDCEIECDNFEEVNMNKVEGKVSDWCPKCKNCKAVTRVHDGKNASIRIIEVDCEDPYDGMVKTLDVDSDICCSMFEPKPPCEKCERFDGTYCHSPNGIFVTSYMALFGDCATGNCPLYEEKKETCETKTAREIELEARVTALLGEVDNLQKANEKLENKVHKLERRLTEEKKRFDRLDREFLMPLAHILYPGEKVCKPYSEILKDIKKMSNYENELISLNTINKGLAEDRKKLINYMRSLKIASDNYLKEFTYEED